MTDFQVKADAVDVDAIMRQIRARIHEKRGVDYTEAEVQDLAKVKLEQFLDPKGVRSDLVAQFRRRRPASAAPPNYEFEDSTLYDTHRGLLRTMRRMLNPLLKLFFNPDKISTALHIQAKANSEFHERLRQREETDTLYYELVHNLVLEVTRLGIEVHNMKMRVESVSSRLDFDERRGRALESVVQYKPTRGSGGQRPPRPSAKTPPAVAVASPTPVPAAPTAAMDTAGSVATETPSAQPAGIVQPAGVVQPSGEPNDQPDGDGERRRRRRRRRRRPGQTMGDQPSVVGAEDGATTGGASEVVAGHPNAPNVDGNGSSDSGSDEQ